MESYSATTANMFYLLEISNYANEADAQLKAEKLKVLNSEILPFYLDKFEAIAKINNGHLALGKLTWADLWFAGVVDYLSWKAGRNLTDNHPNLKKVVDNTLAIDSIKKWVAKRPHTEG